MNSEKEIFKKANEFKEADSYDEAIELYESLLDSQNVNKLELVLQLGGCHYFSKSYKSAYDYFKLALELDKDLEVASLGYYLACVYTERLEEGIMEMQRFLNFHPPVLYKDTIKELQTGLENGYATDFKDIILGFPTDDK